MALEDLNNSFSSSMAALFNPDCAVSNTRSALPWDIGTAVAAAPAYDGKAWLGVLLQLYTSFTYTLRKQLIIQKLKP